MDIKLFALAVGLGPLIQAGKLLLVQQATAEQQALGLLWAVFGILSMLMILIIEIFRSQKQTDTTTTPEDLSTEE